jgi:tripartite-type tricarboxylate transporter receptor subunit TctC
MTIAGVPAALDIQAKGLGKIVAVGGGQRSAALPDVPTYAELGFTEGTFSVPSWVALAAPAGTPVEVVNKVRDGVVKVLAEKPMQDFLARFGWSAMGNTPAQFKAALERETPLIAEAMRTAGVQAE